VTATTLVEMRASGQISAVDLVSHYLETVEALNPVLNAVVTVTKDSALDRARAMDKGLIEPGMLWGLPFVDKDLTNRAGVPTRAGSRVFDDAKPPTTNDPMPEALDRAGGISLGKSAVCEFGLTSYTESQIFPPTANPHNLEVGAGGSSGGAASAVAGGLVPFAPGSDGGGSVRIPAWTCGLVGIKPSRGLIPGGTGFDSLGGLVVPGPLAKNVEDAALLLDAMVGTNPTYRATRPPRGEGSFVQHASLPPLALSISVTTRSPWDYWVDISLDPVAREALQAVADCASNLGHQVAGSAWVPQPGYAEAFVTLWKASAVSLDIPPQSRPLLEPITAYLIEQGEKLQARDLARAVNTLSLFEEHTLRAFEGSDVLVTPGLAVEAPRIGFYNYEDPVENFRQQVLVTPFSSFVNVCGLPALALPVTSTSEGVPVGVQLIGKPGSEATLISLAAQLEAVIGWDPSPNL